MDFFGPWYKGKRNKDTFQIKGLWKVKWTDWTMGSLDDKHVCFVAKWKVHTSHIQVCAFSWQRSRLTIKHGLYLRTVRGRTLSQLAHYPKMCLTAWCVQSFRTSKLFYLSYYVLLTCQSKCAGTLWKGLDCVLENYDCLIIYSDLTIPALFVDHCKTLLRMRAW